MGLKITSELYTDAGVSSEVYVNIDSIKIINKDNLIVSLNNYLNKEARDENPRDTIVARGLYSSIGIPLKVEISTQVEIPLTPEELELNQTEGINLSPQTSTLVEIDYSNFEELISTTIHDFTYSKIKEKLIDKPMNCC